MAGDAVDRTRRLEQKSQPSLKGMRWVLLKNPDKWTVSEQSDMRMFGNSVTTPRTSRAWLQSQQLREILNRKQPRVVVQLLKRWIANVRRSKVEAMKAVAATIERHLEGVAAWARRRLTNGYMESINSLFQAAKRKARGYRLFETMATVILLLAGKLDFSLINPHLR